MKFLISFLLTLSLIPQLQAQESVCDSIYGFTSLTKPATVPSGENYLSITNQWIVPILAELKNEYQIYITSFHLKFVISAEGKIDQAEFMLGQIPDPYRQKIIDSLIQNTKWESGEINGVPVCSILNFPVSCLRWRE